MPRNFKTFAYVIILFVINFWPRINWAQTNLLVVPSYATNSQIANSADAQFAIMARAQTVIGAAEFPPYPIVISKLQWRPDSLTGGPVTNAFIANIQIDLSTSTRDADQLNSVFAQNIGTDDTVVFSGNLNLSTGFILLSNGTTAFDIDLPLQIPFTYDSSRGNLLIDVRNFTGSTVNIYDNSTSSGSDTVSRIVSSTPQATSSDFGDTGGGAMQITYSLADPAPMITAQPTNFTVSINGTATFGVAVVGAQPFSCQWYFNNTNSPIDGATNISLFLSNVQTNQAGFYFVRVTNANGLTLSSNALLTAVPLLITSQPANQTVAPAGTATFAVSVQGGGPLSYQWLFNMTNVIPDATNDSLILTNVQADRVGLYSVQITNNYGTAISSNASLSLGVIVPNYAANFQPVNAENTLANVVRIQTVYSASQFPPYPVVVNELRWRPNASVGGAMTDNIPNIQINLSTTATNVDHLNSTFSKNSGTNDTIVFNGPATVTTSFSALNNGTKAFDISLPLQTPFLYDSSKGNLLVDVHNFSGGSAILYTSGLTTITDTVSRTYSASTSSTTASGADTAGEAMQILYTPAPLPPTISSQPTNRSVIVGGSASFNAVVGPLPVTYQWFYNTNTLVNDATNSSLVLTNIQYNQSGTYSLIASNSYGTTTSAIAVLTVSFPPVNVIIGNTNVMGGNSFTVPVFIAANGIENTISFSLNFNTQRVTYASIELGSGAADGLLLANTSQTASGRLGVTMQLPAGETFAPGTQEVVRVTFLSALVSGAQVVTPITFTNQPINRFVSDARNNKLATNFINGSVTLAISDFEGDTSPRTAGDRSLDIFDWTQVGRFVAGLDTISNASEFQRADVAPKSTSGDGQLKVTDWVQAGRYGATIDAPSVVGGPTIPVTPTILTGGPRAMNIADGSGVKGLNVTVPVVLQSQGNENAVGFSVNFDPAMLKYVSAVKGSADASGTTALMVNTNQASLGTVGLLVALQSGNNFTNGAQQEVATLTFKALNVTSNSPVTFINGPVLLSISDPLANELAANYSNGAVTINPPPTVTAGVAGSNVTLRWPTFGTGFSVQGTGDLLNQAWTNVAYSAQTNGNEIIITIPAPSQNSYFRLQHP
jgi:Ig-like domain-containing protein/cohesin domain-containing protein